MSLINLENLREIIFDLNVELNYKLAENAPEGISIIDTNLLIFASDGENHSIQFLGLLIWSSQMEKQVENILPEKEMMLNEREHFEPYLRSLINDKLRTFQKIIM